MDEESQALIQQALAAFTADKTCVVVAHRLSTIRHFERIIVLENGQVVEDGSHEELLSRQGAYYRLYQAQHHHSQEAM